MENGVEIIRYNPIGSKGGFQDKITDFMRRHAVKYSTKTLSEMGYLYMNAITYIKDHIEARAYFAPELASYKSEEFGEKGRLVPIKELDIFRNYLFAGSVESNIHFDTISVPKYKIVEEDGHIITVTKNDKNYIEKTIMILRLNLQLTMASINDISLKDPMFQVVARSVSGVNKKHTDKQMIISVNFDKEFPVSIDVQYTPNNQYGGYDPDDAIPYLTSLIQKNSQYNNMMDKLKGKVSEDAQKIEDCKSKRFYGGYFNIR